MLRSPILWLIAGTSIHRTQCAAGGRGVRGLQGGAALQGLVDVDSVGRQGSFQCGQTTSHQLSTPDQLRVVDLRGRKGRRRHLSSKGLEMADILDDFIMPGASVEPRCQCGLAFPNMMFTSSNVTVPFHKSTGCRFDSNGS